VVDLHIRIVDQDSEQYKQVDTDVDVTFGHLDVYWKPQAICNLCAFVATATGTPDEKSKQAGSQDDKLGDQKKKTPPLREGE
jgi:hypothetical protein